MSRGARWRGSELPLMLGPVSHYKIAPREVSPADNLPAKIRPARRPPGRGGFLPVNCQPGRLLWGGAYNAERLSMGPATL